MSNAAVAFAITFPNFTYEASSAATFGLRLTPIVIGTLAVTAVCTRGSPFNRSPYCRANSLRLNDCDSVRLASTMNVNSAVDSVNVL